MSKEFSHEIAVVGGGSWATALVKLLCNQDQKIGWWMRSEEAVNHLKNFQHNPRYLQSVQFDVDQLNLSTDLEKILAPAKAVVIATPAAFLVSVF